MPYRVFHDPAGAEWTAWDVIPGSMTERRVAERRLEAATRFGAPERRHTERRVQSRPRYLVAAALSNGWLCFESTDERRRLSPIPSDWARAPEARLVDYCRQAQPVPQSRLRVERGGAANDASIAQARRRDLI